MIPIIDAFPYNGEPIAELRLKYLSEHVTQFVIVESRVTFSGNPKPELYFQKYRDTVFAPFLHKIHFVIIDEFPAEHNTDAWTRERYQRNVIRDIVTKEHDEFILMVCDVDEIPDKHVVGDLRSRYFSFQYPTHLEMKFFYYNFAWLKHNQPWYKAFVINDIGLRRASETLDEMRLGSHTLYIPCAGWHASYFMNRALVSNKLASFSHTECNIPEYNNPTNIDECITTGRDLTGRSGAEDLIPYDISFLPKQFRDFHDKIVFLQRYS